MDHTPESRDAAQSLGPTPFDGTQPSEGEGACEAPEPAPSAEPAPELEPDAPNPEAPDPAAPQPLTFEQTGRAVEALLFAADAPLSLKDLAQRLPGACDLERAVEDLVTHYEGRGVRLSAVAGGYAFRTAEDLAPHFVQFRDEEKKLSRAGLETLAIIAYHQPVTRAEIEEIRGVGVSKGTLDVLLELEWVRLAGRRETPGRPVTFATTQRFLEHFSLSGTGDLPGLEELKAAGLLESRPEALSLSGLEETGQTEEQEEGEAEEQAGEPSDDLDQDGADGGAHHLAAAPSAPQPFEGPAPLFEQADAAPIVAGQEPLNTPQDK